MNRRKRRPLRDYLIAGVLMLVLGWLTWLLVGIVGKEEIARHAAADAAAQLKELDQRHSTMEENLNDLATPRGQEASYRDHFGVAKPGEEVIIVVPAEKTVAEAPLPWWRKFLGQFGL
jgi:cell division protein FtsB